MSTRTRFRAIGAALLAVMLGTAGAIAVASPAAAANFTVNSFADAGAGSLRQAVLDANAADGPDVIRLDFGITPIVTITLTSGALEVTEGVEIVNVGSGFVTIALGQDDNMFEFVPGVGETSRDFIIRGGALVSGQANLILDGNDPDGFDGHAVDTFDATPINSLTIERVFIREFNGGTTESGAAVRVDNASGDITLTDVRANDNDSASNGGAFHITDSGAVTVTRGSFERNDAGGAGRGGAIAVSESGDVTVHGGLYDDNSANDGGAISVVDSGPLTIDQAAVFFDNHSAVLGGAVYADYLNSTRQDVTIEGGDFRENGSGTGGAVFVQAGDTVTVTDVSVFRDNVANGGRGGALAANLVTFLDLTDTQWISNVAADGDGGAVSTVSTDGHLIDLALFSQNTAVNGGAVGIRVPLGQVTIANSVIADNHAVSTDATVGLGGGVWIDENGSAPVDIIRNSISGNEAHGSVTGLGGGIFLDRVGALTRVHDTTFVNNDLGINGSGGVSIAIESINGLAAALDIVNSTFDEEYTAELPNPMVFIQAMAAPANLRVAHSTFVGETGIEVRLEDGYDAELTHSAFETTGAPVLFPQSVELDTSYSAFTQPLDAAEINSLMGNQFGLATLKLGPLQDNGNILPLTREPLTGSPLINTGNPAVTGQPLYDERGEGFARIIQIIDIGAVEVQKPVLANTGSAVDAAPLGIAALLLLIGGCAVIVVARRRIAAP